VTWAWAGIVAWRFPAPASWTSAVAGEPETIGTFIAQFSKQFYSLLSSKKTYIVCILILKVRNYQVNHHNWVSIILSFIE